jgi:Fe-S oxidoreductase
VALFVGDDAYYAWPSVLAAALTLLKAAGVEPVLVGTGRNNGYLASSLGLHDTAVSLARANLEELRAAGAGRLLVLTPGDYYTFSRLYDERLGLAWPEDVELMEVLSFLAGRLETGHLQFDRADDGLPYAYVDPTHAARMDDRLEGGRHGAPRRLLAACTSTPGVNMFWREGRAHPCGNTALQFTRPEISEKLTRARLGDAVNVGARRVITEDPGCLAQLSRYAPQFGLQVEGLYELLANNLN